MKKSLLSLAALLIAGSAVAQVNFTFNRTSTTEATVNVAKDGENVTNIAATIAIAGASEASEYQSKGQTASNTNLLCISRNTADATTDKPNKYTIAITNNSSEAITFDYIRVSGVALNSEGAYQSKSVDRARNFVVKYGNTTLPSVLKQICDNDHCNGTATNNLFDATTTQTIAVGATYEISIAIDNNVEDATKKQGCFYALKEVSLVNTHTLTVGTTGYATLMLGYNATIPDGADCYAAAVDDDKAVLTAIVGTLAANTPVLVQADAADYTFEPTPDATAVENNELEGSLSAKSIAVADGTVCYVLAKPAGQDAAFYEVNTNADCFECKANKAYLPVVGSSAARISFDFGTETGIAETESGNLKTEMYDLSGRRVQGAQKGIFIVNGKKVIK